METNLLQILAIHFYRTTVIKLDKTEESLENRTLTSTGPTNNTDLHSGLNCAVKSLNTRLEILTVLHLNIVELDFTLLGPINLLQVLVDFLLKVVFLLNLGVLIQSLR